MDYSRSIVEKWGLPESLGPKSYIFEELVMINKIKAFKVITPQSRNKPRTPAPLPLSKSVRGIKLFNPRWFGSVRSFLFPGVSFVQQVIGCL